MNEYRCTRPNVYGPGTPGHTDSSARQGFYIRAENKTDAFRQMDVKFPGDEIDVKLWKENISQPFYNANT